MPFSGFHGADLLIILAIALLIFGPKKLPEMGASIGKSIKEFKKGMAELTEPKAEKPDTYETINREPVVVNSVVTEPDPLLVNSIVTESLVANPIVTEPVSEIYETPTSFESELEEQEETKVQ